MDTVTKELFDIFRKYHFDSKPELNTEAREALCLFLKKLKKTKSRKSYQGSQDYMVYLHYLMIMRRGLLDENYLIVCNELGSLIDRFPPTETRIKLIIIELLEEFLKE